MEIYEARLASFNAVHPATKKRASDPKGARALKWPHKKLSPVQLAAAGFFYHPTSSSPDNTTCYLCKSNVDGWEEDDDPVEEHLKLSPDCGWAITVSIEKQIDGGDYNVENPTSDKILDARRMTFGSIWPHESKRGWVCKTQKMVDAGWHYCPTPESDDFVKCSYCSLSLDGWEPKDHPHDEHQRRSPDCIFFTLCAKPHGGRTKKGRVSKASRLSTQSNLTQMSEDASIAETELNGDESMLSTTQNSQSSKTKKSKKGAKSKKAAPKPKSRAAKAKTEDPGPVSSYVEPEDDDFEIKIDAFPIPTRAGKKRNSTEMNAANESGPPSDGPVKIQEPPAKRRATRTRSSVAPGPIVLVPDRKEQPSDSLMMDAEDISPLPAPASKKAGCRMSKRTSSSTRKVSSTSTASKASLRAHIPNDEDIDAALELDLDRPLTDEEGDAEPLRQPKGRRLTKTKPGAGRGMASVAPTRRGTRASGITVDESTVEIASAQSVIAESDQVPVNAAIVEIGREDPVVEAKPKGRATKKTTHKVSKKTEAQIVTSQGANDERAAAAVIEEVAEQIMPESPSRELPARRTRTSTLAISQDADAVDLNLESSLLELHTAENDSSHETDASVTAQGRGKHNGGKGLKEPKKPKVGKKQPLTSREVEDTVSSPTSESTHYKEAMEIDTSNEHTDDETQRPKKPGPKTKKGAKAIKTKKTTTQPQPLSTPPPVDPPKERTPTPIYEDDAPTSPKAASIQSTPPKAASIHSTPHPTPSPQSSDAENHPPSSRPSALRPPLTLLHYSSSNPHQATHPPQTQPTITTPTPPSPNKPTSSFSKLHSTLPWTSIDLEQIFTTTTNTDNQENPDLFPSSFDVDVDVGAGKGTSTTTPLLLTSPEKKMSVEEWIRHRARRGEEGLRAECERIVGRFEGEGVRALRVVEGIVCVE